MKRVFITIVLIAANLVGLYILNEYVHNKDSSSQPAQAVTKR